MRPRLPPLPRSRSARRTRRHNPLLLRLLQRRHLIVYVCAALAVAIAIITTLFLFMRMRQHPSSLALQSSFLSSFALAYDVLHCRRTLVLCAYDEASIHLAWTQIQAIRKLSPLAQEANVTVYHVNELQQQQHQQQENEDKAIKQLEALGGVKVVNLAPWLASWTSRFFSETGVSEGMEDERVDIKFYKGFLCKAAGLLHAATTQTFEEGEEKDRHEQQEQSQHLIALVDSEVVLLQDPFSLAETPIFQETGTFLFSDRQLKRPKKVSPFSEYQELLTRLYHGYQEEGTTTNNNTTLSSAAGARRPLPAALTESPIFQEWSWDYGESAFLLFDGTKHASTTFHALQFLLTVDSPLFRSMSYGDKELYWLAVVFAGAVPLRMNPWVPTAVGTVQEIEDQGDAGKKHKKKKKKKVEVVCSWANTLAQYVSQDAQALFYLNGEGCEDWIVRGNPFLLQEAYIPTQVRNRMKKKEVEEEEEQGQVQNLCTLAGKKGATLLPENVKARLQVYREIYLAW